MHIGIEAHGFWGKAEGQAKAIHGLVMALSHVDTENRYTLFMNAVRSREERLRAVQKQIDNPRFKVRLLPLPNIPHPAALFLRDHVVWPWVARREGVDVFHSTSYRGIFGLRMRTVLTIHDFAYHAHPEVFTSRSLAYYRRLPRDAARAAIVVTDSEYTKRDAVRILGLSESKVRVVYYGIDLDRFRPDFSAEAVAEVRLRYGLVGRTVLSVGNVNPKKNVARLISAFRRLRETVSDAQLILVGKETSYGYTLREKIEAWGLAPHVCFTGYIPDEDLPLLYQAADLFVFPSLFEGFGLPAVEAMACGTPVVASNTTSLPEVAGNAALLVDPLDTDQIAEAMGKVLCDDTLRSELVEKGLQRVHLFSWDQAARAALDAYRDAYDASDRALLGGER